MVLHSVSPTLCQTIVYGCIPSMPKLIFPEHYLSVSESRTVFPLLVRKRQANLFPNLTPFSEKIIALDNLPSKSPKRDRTLLRNLNPLNKSHADKSAQFFRAHYFSFASHGQISQAKIPLLNRQLEPVANKHQTDSRTK